MTAVGSTGAVAGVEVSRGCPYWGVCPVCGLASGVSSGLPHEGQNFDPSATDALQCGQNMMTPFPLKVMPWAHDATKRHLNAINYGMFVMVSQESYCKRK
jgi:hypothetical protein